MATAATEILSVDRLKLALGITEQTDPDLDQQLAGYIEAGVARVEDLLGSPMLARQISVGLESPVPEQKLEIDLPDFVRWSGYVYVPKGDEMWEPADGTLHPGAVAVGVDGEEGYVPAVPRTVGYPHTVTRDKWKRGSRPRFLTVYPNGLDEDTKKWPDMEPDSFSLTAMTAFDPIPETLVAAVELFARDLFDGTDRIGSTDAVRDICRAHKVYGAADARR